jgi:hypothetical protein
MTNVWPPHGSRLGLKKIFETIENFKKPHVPSPKRNSPKKPSVPKLSHIIINKLTLNNLKKLNSFNFPVNTRNKLNNRRKKLVQLLKNKESQINANVNLKHLKLLENKCIELKKNINKNNEISKINKLIFLRTGPALQLKLHRIAMKMRGLKNKAYKETVNKHIISGLFN